MRTACFSRLEVEEFVPPENSVLICISDPESKYPHIQEGWEQVRFYQFWDTSPDKPDRTRFPALAELVPPPTEQQIRSIFDFINLYSDHNIFVSCEAGVSRSAAVREYLFRHGWGPCSVEQKNRMVHPNSYILSELERMWHINYEHITGEKYVAQS